MPSLIVSKRILLPLVVLLSGAASAQVTAVAGSASFGVDFGCAPSGIVPNEFNLNGFYEEIDLISSPSGGTSNWHGWGSVSWNYTVGSTASFVVNGSSAEGNNGSVCTMPGGGTGMTSTTPR
jgi:hypothetical protein